MKTPALSSLSAVLTAVAALSGCATSGSEFDEYGVDDSFLSDGKSDAWGIGGTSYEAAAILEVASVSTESQLKAIGIATRAARSTVAASRPFATLTALDAVSYTGEAYFTHLLDHVVAKGLVGRCGDGKVQPSTGERCDGTAGCSTTCQSAEDFDTSMIGARLAIPSTIGPLYRLVALPNDSFLLMGSSQASPGSPLVLGGRSLTRAGTFAAVIDHAGNVTSLHAVTTGGQSLTDGPLALRTWGSRVQFQHRQSAFELDLATGFATRVGTLTGDLKLVRAFDNGDVLARGLGYVSLIDPVALESVWSLHCTDALTPDAFDVTDHDLWCTEDRATYTEQPVRYSLDGDLETAPAPAAVLQVMPAAIAAGGSGLLVIDAVDYADFSEHNNTGSLVSSVQIPGALQPHWTTPEIQSYAIDAIGKQAITINRQNYAGDRLGRSDNAYQRQVSFSRAGAVTAKVTYFPQTTGKPQVASTASSIAVLDRARFTAAQPSLATAGPTLMILFR